MMNEFSSDIDSYLEENPHIEPGLWGEWVGVVCGWEGIAKPTFEEWKQLRKTWYPGLAPIDSVAELKKMRSSK